MPEFVQPAWLVAGVLLVPALWLLHRLRRTLRRLVVPALFLWPGQARQSGAGVTRQHAERRWPLRAAVAASICIALAAPLWPGKAAPLIVWLDESATMFARDGERARIDEALALLREALAESDIHRFELRSVQRELAALRIESGSDWIGQARAWIRAVPGPPLQAHAVGPGDWLVSDGVSADVRRWAGRVGFARVIQPGSATLNSAVLRISARRALHEPEQLDVYVAVGHAGGTPGTLTLSDRDTVLATRSVTGRERLEEFVFTIPHGRRALVAELSAADALAADNRLELGFFDPLVGLQLDPACPAWVGAAVGAHAAFVPRAAAATRLSCSPDPPAGPRSLHLHSGRMLPGASAPAWQRRAGDPQQLPLDAGWRALDEAPPVDRHALLTLDGRAMVRDSAGAIETWIDFSAASPAANALLVAGLLERLVPEAGAAHAWQARAGHGPDLAPQPIETAVHAPALAVDSRGNARVVLLAAALLLVLGDLALRWHERDLAR